VVRCPLTCHTNITTLTLIPALRFAPGLITMEIVTLGFPIYQIWKHKKEVRETYRALAEFDKKRLRSFDQKRLNFIDDTTTTGSLTTKSTSSKRRQMYPMDSLDACLSGSHDSLQMYASCMELNGENIIFLTRVLDFKRQCEQLFCSTCRSDTDFRRARGVRFRVALNIYVALVHNQTASYPINVESHIYNLLDAIFGPATALVASASNSRTPSINSNSSHPTPWDLPANPPENESAPPSYPMQAMGHRNASRPGTAKKNPGSESSEHIVEVGVDHDSNGGLTAEEGGEEDPLEGLEVPADFDEVVFNPAFQSVRYMVWTETWQRYMSWKDKGGVAQA
jgi:hypothetical protein